MAHLNIIVGLLVLTVTVLMNTRPAEAAACTDAGSCQNGGSCPTDGSHPGETPCTCIDNYSGDTCENVCSAGGSECQNGGTCDTASDTNVCKCGDYKGKRCADECTEDADCDASEGSCVDGTPKTCKCEDTTKKGPKCALENGASAVTGFSLISLLVVLTGHLL